MNISKKFFRLFFGLYLIGTLNLDGHYVQNLALVEEIVLLDDLYKALNAKKPTVIKLYSKNCPHCKIFEKPFEETAKKYQSIDFFSANGKTLDASKIIKDITNNQIKIPGYPSILFIKNGKIVDYLIGGDPKKHTEKVKKLIKQ